MTCPPLIPAALAAGIIDVHLSPRRWSGNHGAMSQFGVGGDVAGDPIAERDLIEVLTRWQEAGAVWRVVARSRSQVTIALCRCDGGEEVERLMTAHPGTVDFLAGRDSSED